MKSSSELKKLEMILSDNMKALKLLLFIAILIPFGADAQCRSFTKKNCRPEIDPYIHNGQLNSAVLYSGDSADIQLTFYSGQDYRLVVCSEEQLGDTHFQVFDIEKNLIYDSQGKEKQTFDFKVQSTRQLIVTVIIPESSSTHDIDTSGCVSVLVGFKN